MYDIIYDAVDWPAASRRDKSADKTAGANRRRQLPTASTYRQSTNCQPPTCAAANCADTVSNSSKKRSFARMASANSTSCSFSRTSCSQELTQTKNKNKNKCTPKQCEKTCNELLLAHQLLARADTTQNKTKNDKNK